MEKIYIVDCVIHERRIVAAETEEEAKQKAYDDDYMDNEILDFSRTVVDELEY